MDQKITSKRIMIAASGSGGGKTTITCALLRALKEAGLECAAFKCGPDYIDPLWHRAAAGVESGNLDPYFAGEDGVREILAGCEDRYAVIEGVMGIYDGKRPDSLQGSCYEIASITRTPILLAVDASGTGRTVISLIKGVLLDDTEHLIKGILLNRISAGFYERLLPVLKQEIGGIRSDVRIVGFFPKDPAICLESRHLGLHLPWEVEDPGEKTGKAAENLKQHADLDAVIALMEEAPVISAGALPETGKDADAPGPVLAVARDEAFCFYYRENLEQFEKRGVTIRFFSPLLDACLPDGTGGILLGGGYPENHLKTLSKNRSMLESIREAIRRGVPSLAECGGFMYLHRAVTDAEGNRYAMAGAFDAECHFAGHLVRFGYLELADVKEPFASDELAGSMVGMKGHEFHYYESSDNGDAFTACAPGGGKSRNCMVVKNGGIWGFPHFYYASAPAFVDAFISRMGK